MNLRVIEDYKLIDAETPGLVSQDAITLHGVEYGGIDYGSATAYWKYGFRHVVKVREGVLQPRCDRMPLKGDEPYLNEWVSSLQGACAIHLPPQYGLDFVPASFVMTVYKGDAIRLVELDPQRFEHASWEDVQHWDLLTLGVDIDSDLAKEKISQWRELLAESDKN